MLPADELWPINSTWGFHAGGGAFRDVHVFTEALNSRYGQATGLDDYLMKAQVLAYEGERAMFEAYGRNKYTSTGVIQWMLNNSWPSMIWHLYDYYLRPGGSYFGAKKGCEYLHVQYSYDDQSIVVVNSYYQAFPGMKVSAKVYNLDMSPKFSKDATIDVPPDSTNKVFILPTLADLSKTYFVRLDLNDATGKNVSNNFYWLSTQPDVLDWDHSTWYVTPTKTFADLTALRGLPKVEVQATAHSETNGDDGVTRISVENPSHSLAFFVHFKVAAEGARFGFEEGGGSGDDEVLPILWSDNYVSLLPGEKRMLVAELFFGRSIPGRAPLTDAEWARFAAEIVTPNFPAGFTVFDGEGQWRNPAAHRIVRERSKILVVAVERSPELAGRLGAVIDAYKARFRQSSVGLITRDSCAAF
jgi:exo-1,4-beta-D-glucosaminidase